MDMATIQILISVLGFLIVLSAFFLARSKESEDRGRLMQRVDTLEAMITELKNNHQTIATDVACHDTDLSKVTTEIAGIKDMIKLIDKKLDRLIDRRPAEREA